MADWLLGLLDVTWCTDRLGVFHAASTRGRQRKFRRVFLYLNESSYGPTCVEKFDQDIVVEELGAGSRASLRISQYIKSQDRITCIPAFLHVHNKHLISQSWATSSETEMQSVKPFTILYDEPDEEKGHTAFFIQPDGL